MAIEGIVKVNVPFSGTYKKMKVDSKRRFIIPNQLREIFLLRQRRKVIKNCLAFMAPGKLPVMATITDFPSPEQCPNYNLVRMDTQGRIGISSNIYLDVPEDRTIDFVGHGDYIEVRASNYQSSSTS